MSTQARFKVNVIDYVDVDITKEADPDDEWSKESTYESHSIRGIETGPNCYELKVEFPVLPNTPYYLLYYNYSTGDSFGRDEGKIEFVGLYRDPTLAHKCEAAMTTAANSGNSEAVIWNDNGIEYTEYLPCVNDYFGSFDWADVQTVYLK